MSDVADHAELLRFLATSLVAEKGAVEVRVADQERASVLEFQVAREELGKVIGREGKTIHALRTVVQASARAAGHKVIVEVAHARRGGRREGRDGASAASSEPAAAADVAASTPVSST